MKFFTIANIFQSIYENASKDCIVSDIASIDQKNIYIKFSVDPDGCFVSFDKIENYSKGSGCRVLLNGWIGIENNSLLIKFMQSFGSESLFYDMNWNRVYFEN